jgi:cytochrome P450
MSLPLQNAELIGRMPPGPAPQRIPFFGRQAQKMRFYRDPIAYHQHVYNTYGDLASFIQGGQKILIYNPEYNRQVFNQPDVFQVERIVMPGPKDSALHRLGLGLNSMNGELHRRQRRLVLPAFHRQHIEHYRDSMIAVTQRIIDELELHQTTDIAHVMQKLTLCVASETLFGVDALDDANSLGHKIARWIKFNANRWIYMFPYDLPGTPLRQLKTLSIELEQYILQLLEQKRAQPSAHRDALALLLQARDEDGSALSDDEIIGQTTLMFIAGFETSAVALTWTLFLLAQHPEIYADLVDEMQSVLHGDAPTTAQTMQMPLLDRVIKESLRLFPPAIQGGRISTQDFAMGGYEFAAGTKVMYSEFMTHRLPDIYPDPLLFNPNRWENFDPGTFAYIPFLAGPRRCLGAEFAMLEMKIVLSMLLQRYRISLPQQTHIDRKVLFTLEPKDGLALELHPFDRNFRKSTVTGNVNELVSLH